MVLPLSKFGSITTTDFRIARANKREHAPEDSVDQLRDLLRQHTQEATNEALESGGEVPPAKIESLANLGRLIELREGA